MLHSISVWFKVGLGWLVNAYSSHSTHCVRGGGGVYSQFIHKFTKVGSQNTKGVGAQEARWWFCKRTRRGHGGGHVALRTVTTVVGLWSSTQQCCVGYGQWRWGSSSYPRSSYMGPLYWFKEASAFDFEYSSNIYSKLKICFLYLFLYIYIYQPCSHVNVQ